MSRSRSTLAILLVVPLALASTGRADLVLDGGPIGGDCPAIGVWHAPTRTCSLTADVADQIWIVSPDVTLDCELTALEIVFTDDGGVPLASAQANAIFQTLRLYRDNGSGVFEEANDSLVATVGSFTLDGDGAQVVPLADDDPNARVAFGSPASFFVTLEMTANAGSQPVNAFQVRHRALSDAADDADHDIGLDYDAGSLVGTGPVDTELSTATCQAPFDLVLVDRTISTTVVCEAGTTLDFTGSEVIASGDLTLRAGITVRLGLDAAFSGTLEVENDPSLIPP